MRKVEEEEKKQDEEEEENDADDDDEEEESGGRVPSERNSQLSCDDRSPPRSYPQYNSHPIPSDTLR